LCDVGGFLRRRNHPHPAPRCSAVWMAVASMVVFPLPAAPSTITRGSARRPLRRPRSGQCRGRRPAPTGARPAPPAHLSGKRAARRSRSSASACMTRTLVRCATCSRHRCVRREDREAVLQCQPRCNRDEVAYLGGGGAHAVLGHDPGRVLGHGVRRPRGRCGGATIQRARDATSCTLRSSSPPSARRGVVQCLGVVSGLAQLCHPRGFLGQRGGLLRRAFIRPRLGSQAGGDDGPHALAGVRFVPFGFEAFEVRPTCAPRLDMTALKGCNSTTSPVTGSRVRPCRSSTAASCGLAAITAVPRARIAPCCLNSAAVNSARHFPAANTRVPICM
jgi:hypothetical protein